MNEESVFTNALARTDPAERRAYLDEACGADSALRREVEALLATHEADSGFMQRPAAEQLAAGGTTNAATEALTRAGRDSPGHAHAATTDTTGGAQPSDDDLAFLAAPSESGHLGRVGHYEVHSVIGKGGFGIVLKAFDQRLHRMVAIKVLAPALAANGAARKRFIREARAAAAVKNEHVVGIYEVQEEAQPPYLVMEYIEGISLEDKVDRHGPLGVTAILRIGMQIAEGLAAAHKQGLVHRDIKPANILLENGVERVKITDFGLARAVDDASVTQSGTIAGTPMYMSPEQAEGLAIDHRSDLFSLGTVMYAMCTGHPPFRAVGTMAVLKRVVEETPRPIREINADIPDWLCAIIAKLHAKKPEARLQTAKQVAEVLGQGLAHVQQPGHAAAPVPSPGETPLTMAANRWHVGDQVLAPLVPEWLYVCKVLQITEDSVLVTFEDAYMAWVRTADVLPDNVGKNTRVLGFVGWWSGHRPGTVTERRDDSVHVLYDNGSRKWTKLNKIVVPTDKVATPGVVVSAAPSNPKATLPSQVVASPYVHHATRQSAKLVILGSVLGVSLGLVLGLMNPLLPWADNREPDRDTMTLFSVIGGVIGSFLAMALASRLFMSDIRTRVGNGIGVAEPLSAATRGDRRSTVAWAWPIAAGIFVVVTVLGVLWFRGGANVTISADDPDLQVTFIGQDRPAIEVAGPALNMISLPAGTYNVCIKCGAGRKLTFVSMGEWPEPRTYARGEDEVQFELKLRGGQHPTIIIKTTSIRPSEPTSEQRGQPEPEWVQLFNGKDRKGWKSHRVWNGSWTVKDSHLVSTGKRCILFTERGDFERFHLRAKLRFTAASTGRIYFLSAWPDPAFDVYTPAGNFATLDAKEPGCLGVSGDGFVLTDDANLGLKAGEWYTLEIVADNAITIKVNGVKTAGGSGKRNPKFARGHIALEHNGPGLEIERLEIKTLPTEERGWVRLFNGQDLTGWETTGEKKHRWIVQDGAIVGEASGLAYLVSKRADFENFHLRVEAKINKGARGGVSFRAQPDLGMPHPGYDVEIAGDAPHPHTGSLWCRRVPPAATNVLYEADRVLHPPDSWFTLEVVADGNRITTIVNGKKVGSAIDDSFHKGRIALQVWEGQSVVQFKKVEIKELPPRPGARTQLGATLQSQAPDRLACVRQTSRLVDGGLRHGPACRTAELYPKRLQCSQSALQDCRLEEKPRRC